MGYVTAALAIGAAVAGAYSAKKGEAVINKKGTGYKVYVGNDGSIKETHKHPGTSGYHNIDTSHNPLYERHPKGEIDPKYEKDVDGTYKYVAED